MQALLLFRSTLPSVHCAPRSGCSRSTTSWVECRVDRATLLRAVEQQAQKVFHAAYDLPDSWYRFDPECRDEEHDRGMSMTQLLLESARRHDETEKSPKV